VSTYYLPSQICSLLNPATETLYKEIEKTDYLYNKMYRNDTLKKHCISEKATYTTKLASHYIAMTTKT